MKTIESFGKPIEGTYIDPLGNLHFPERFFFGTGTSPYQVEGNVDGTRFNNWDAEFMRHPEKWPYSPAKLGAEVGANWWTEGVAENDFALLSGIGLRTIRLGLEWARIQPEENVFSKQALDRYRRMIDSLHSLKVTPLLTLNHCTIPAWIEGGWENPKIAEYFKLYTGVAADRFGDVKTWFPINEGALLAQLGYLLGSFPPFKKGNLLSYKKVIEASVASNAAIYQTLKDNIDCAKVGSTHSIIGFVPHNPDSPIDRFLARFCDRMVNRVNLGKVTEYLDPMMEYADFFGFNGYTGYSVRFNPHALGFEWMKDIPFPKKAYGVEFAVPENAFQGDNGWTSVPEILGETVRKYYKDYKKPIIISENGITDEADTRRKRFITDHLKVFHGLLMEGIPIEGYIHWASVRTLEFMEGEKYDFGLVGIDRETGERRIKESAKYYSEIASAHILPKL